MDGGWLGAVAGRRRAVHRVLLLAAVPLEPVCKHKRVDGFENKLQALVDDILPSAIAVFSYAIG